MLDERIVPSFFLSEFIDSDEAVRLGIDNTPGPDELANIRKILAPRMQRVRELLGAPVLISSGFRSKALNKAVKGSPTSQHCAGLAADFRAPHLGSPRQVAEKLLAFRTGLAFDQLIYEGTWVHIGFPEAGKTPKDEVLTAHFFPNQTTYTPGLA